MDLVRSKHWENIRTHKTFKFLISGVTAVVVEYAIFALVMLADPALLYIAQTVSFLCGFVVSFLMNKFWVFRSSGTILNELPKYSLIATINLFITNIALGVLVYRVGVIFWVAKVIIIIFVAAWNYVLFNKFVFTGSASRTKQ